MISTTRLLTSVVVLSAALSAQSLTMTEANMVVATGSVPGSNAAATFDLRADAIAADHGFQHWWFYRLAGDTQEFALKGPATGGVPPHLTPPIAISPTWTRVVCCAPTSTWTSTRQGPPAVCSRAV